MDKIVSTFQMGLKEIYLNKCCRFHLNDHITFYYILVNTIWLMLVIAIIMLVQSFVCWLIWFLFQIVELVCWVCLYYITNIEDFSNRQRKGERIQLDEKSKEITKYIILCFCSLDMRWMRAMLCTICESSMKILTLYSVIREFTIFHYEYTSAIRANPTKWS